MSTKKSISGPYRATKLWNDAVRSFYNGMPVSRHWRGLRQYDRCFTGCEAVDWLHNHLTKDPNFVNTVSRDQTIKLLRKFVKSGLIEDVRGSNSRPEDFKDARELYRFSNRSPLKALRTPKTPGRAPLATLNNGNSNNKDEGASPILRRPRIYSSLRESTRSKRRWTSEYSGGDNAFNERRVEQEEEEGVEGSLQQCHLVHKKLSPEETDHVWKQVFVGKLDATCQELLYTPSNTVVPDSVVCGGTVRHNTTQLSSRGVVTLAEHHHDNLPTWVLTAMRCMAQWPDVGDLSCNIPNYPGVERDVFKIVRDFFTNMVSPLIPYELYEPIIRMYIGAEFLDISRRSTTNPFTPETSHSTAPEEDVESEDLDFEDGDSVDDLMLNMSIGGQQKTSTPNVESEVFGNRTSETGFARYCALRDPTATSRTPLPSPGNARSGFERRSSVRDSSSHYIPQTPSLSRNVALNVSKLQSLKLRRLKNYTDFKEDSLYPADSECDPSPVESQRGLSSEFQHGLQLTESQRNLSSTPFTATHHNKENTRPNSRASGEILVGRQPETVRSMKTNDQVRRMKRESEAKGMGGVEAWRGGGRNDGFETGKSINNGDFEARNAIRNGDFRGNAIKCGDFETRRADRKEDLEARLSGKNTDLDAGRVGDRNGDFETVSLPQNEDYESVPLPKNCCFETAFTSDSPKTRIIPQKSVDSLHMRQKLGKLNWDKPRPKSIAVPSSSIPSDPRDFPPNVSTVSDLFKSSIMSSTGSDGTGANSMTLDKSVYMSATEKSAYTSTTEKVPYMNSSNRSPYTLDISPYMTKLDRSPMNRSRSAGNLEALDQDRCSPVPQVTSSEHNLNQIQPTRSLASRIRDSIKRKQIKDDSMSKKRGVSGSGKVVREQTLDRLRTKSGGYMNLALAPAPSPQGDAESLGSEVRYDASHLRTKSGGFLNLALAPSSDSVDSGRFTSSGQLTSRSDLAVLDNPRPDPRVYQDPSRCKLAIVRSESVFNHPVQLTRYSVQSEQAGCRDPMFTEGRARSVSPLGYPLPEVNRRRVTTPDGCLSHSLSSSGHSVYHSAISQSASQLDILPSAISHSDHQRLPGNQCDVHRGSQSVAVQTSAILPRCSVSPPSHPVDPSVGQQGTAGHPNSHHHTSQPSRSIQAVSGMGGIYAARAEVTSGVDPGVGRVNPPAPAPPRSPHPYTRQGPIHPRATPRLLTREGREAALTSLRLLLLLLPPPLRRSLHLLLRMSAKMSANPSLQLDDHLTTRTLVLSTFVRSVLLSAQESDYDELLCLRIMAFLMDNHDYVLRPPPDLSILVHRALVSLQRKIVFGPTSEELTYCRQMTARDYQRQKLTGSQLFLAELLGQIVDNPKLSDKERKKKLKEFKSLYPDVYRVRFPSEPVKKEGRLRGLMKLASLTSIGRNKAIRM